MYDCLYYWIFAPLRGGIRDAPDVLPVTTLDIVDPSGKNFPLNIYNDTNSEPLFARLVISSLHEKEIPEKLFPFLQLVKEHILTTMRLLHDTQFSLAYVSTVYSFFEVGKPWVVATEIEMNGHTPMDGGQFKDVFIHTFSIREIARLYSDGQDERIPLQYRFLSFYKMLELSFRSRGNWKSEELRTFLQPFEHEFKALGYLREPSNVIHPLRDKCAHIQTGKKGNKEVIGVTHLNLRDIQEIEKLMPLMRAIAATLINLRVKGKLALNVDPAFSTQMVPTKSVR